MAPRNTYNGREDRGKYENTKGRGKSRSAGRTVSNDLDTIGEYGKRGYAKTKDVSRKAYAKTREKSGQAYSYAKRHIKAQNERRAEKKRIKAEKAARTRDTGTDRVPRASSNSTMESIFAAQDRIAQRAAEKREKERMEREKENPQPKKKHRWF